MNTLYKYPNHSAKLLNFRIFSGIHFLLIVCCLLIFASCGSTKKIKKGKVSDLANRIEKSAVFNTAFTGFMLYDPNESETIYASNSDKYFVPASNTKIFTLYSSLQILGDSIPALKYVVRGDSLIFWGLGDPTFLHHYLNAEYEVATFLRNRKEQLYFCSHNFQDKKYGPGWAWDDYMDYYQVEKSPFPIYGNVVQFNRQENNPKLNITPIHFRKNMTVDKKITDVNRPLTTNQFHYNPNDLSEYEDEIPFIYSDELFLSLLSQALGKEVKQYQHPIMPPAESKIIYSRNVDEAYQRLMQDSDNFIAEQLMLACSAKVLDDTMNTRKAIDYVKEMLLIDLPDEALWYDGSGLSRYNMFTPRSVVHILNAIYQQNDFERIRNIFPTGGESGTIKSWYAGDPPYVFAKTGTLRNRHCLSGYLQTKSGKVLIFSFMHNNYPTGSRPFKEEMERILEFLVLNF